MMNSRSRRFPRRPRRALLAAALALLAAGGLTACGGAPGPDPSAGVFDQGVWDSAVWR